MKPQREVHLVPWWHWVRLSTVLAWVCRRSGEMLEEAARRLDRCERCGRSRYYGEACWPYLKEIEERRLDRVRKEEYARLVKGGY